MPMSTPGPGKGRSSPLGAPPGAGRGHGPWRGRETDGWGTQFESGPPWLRAFGGLAGPHFGSPGGPRAGRGDVRLALLGILAEQPMHGYQLIREIARRSRGSWRVSPGSVYPTLSQLANEGLAEAEEGDGRRAYHLTDLGHREVRERSDVFDALWLKAEDGEGNSHRDLAGLAFGVAAAAMQVASAGTEDNRAAAAELLEQTRRSLYRLLADPEET